MFSTHLSLAAAAAVGALFLASPGPTDAQNPYAPMTPTYPAPSNPSSAPEDHTLSTAPGAKNSKAPAGPLSHLLKRIGLPQPSGEIKIPPVDAGVIVVRVPDASAEVLFDGEQTYTAGRTRTFVTPFLTDGKTEKYKVSARWKRDGAEATREQEVEASPGEITVVDFSRPADK